jgi:hypothetical protein
VLETTSVASASEAFHTSSAMPVQGERRKRGKVIVADLDRDRLFQGPFPPPPTRSHAVGASEIDGHS